MHEQCLKNPRLQGGCSELVATAHDPRNGHEGIQVRVHTLVGMPHVRARPVCDTAPTEGRDAARTPRRGHAPGVHGASAATDPPWPGAGRNGRGRATGGPSLPPPTPSAGPTHEPLPPLAWRLQYLFEGVDVCFIGTGWIMWSFPCLDGPLGLYYGPSWGVGA